MRRCMKGLLVIIGWAVVFCFAVLIVSPIVSIFVDTSTYSIPLEYVVPMYVIIISVGIPIMYSAVFLIMPLVMATFEVLDDVSR